MDLSYEKLYEKYRLLEEENRHLKNELMQLRAMLAVEQTEAYCSTYFTSKENIPEQNNKSITQNSSSKDKIELFKSLFKGREDVCAKRWKNKPGYSPYCLNDFRLGICNKPKINCIECKNSNFTHLDEEQIKNHLSGKHVLGLYPMTANDTCFLLAMDFDESTWNKDVRIVLKVCNENNISAYAERSRSGNGCHMWFFFEKETKASQARKFRVLVQK